MVTSVLCNQEYMYDVRNLLMVKQVKMKNDLVNGHAASSTFYQVFDKYL